MSETDESAKKLRKRRPFRLMPMTMTMLGLVLVVKINDVYLGSRHLREIYGVRDASAEDKKEEASKSEGGAKAEEGQATGKEEGSSGEKNEAAKEAAPEQGEVSASGEGKDSKKEGGDKKPKPPVPGVDTTYGTSKTSLKDIEEFKAKQAIPRFTQNEIDLLQNLVKRRDELDQRERELDIKSKVLDASEKRVNDKLSEMKTMQADLTKIVSQYNEKQDTQVKSLVKIYENMKPADAASIFNEMDMPILLEVIDKMSERKVAPLLAAMSPLKARDITQELAAMRRSANKGAAK